MRRILFILWLGLTACFGQAPYVFDIASLPQSVASSSCPYTNALYADVIASSVAWDDGNGTFTDSVSNFNCLAQGGTVTRTDFTDNDILVLTNLVSFTNLQIVSLNLAAGSIGIPQTELTNLHKLATYVQSSVVTPVSLYFTGLTNLQYFDITGTAAGPEVRVNGCTSLTNLVMDNFGMTTNMQDNALCDCDVNGNSGGSYANSGGNEYPSNTGLQCMTNLLAKGWTVSLPDP